MHLMVRLPAGLDDVAIAAAAAQRGVRVRALSPMYVDPSPDRGLLLGYGRVVEERVDAAVEALATVLRAFGADR